MNIREHYDQYSDYDQRPSPNNPPEVWEYSRSYTGKILFLCERCGFEYLASVKSKLSKRSSCRRCAASVVKPGESLAEKRPDLITQWSEDNDRSPYEVSAKSGYRAQWVCSDNNEHQWTAPVSERNRHGSTEKGSGCPQCAVQKASQATAGVDDCITTHPELSQWIQDETKLLHLRKSSQEPVVWTCSRGHVFTKTVKSMVRSMTCPVCPKVVAQGNQAAQHLTPQALSEWSDINPLPPTEVSRNSATVVFWECSQCHHEWSTPVYQRVNNNSGCPRCARIVSTAEQDIADYVVSILPGGTIVRNSRSVIRPQELDIFIPEKNIAIEYNGLYWHSEDQGKTRNYHYDKWKACQDKNIQLITIWEDEWRDHRSIVKKMLSHKLGVSSQRRHYARNLQVSTVNKPQAQQFCDDNHIQGFMRGSVYYGLVDETTGELAAISIWTKRGDVLYLDRYCTNSIVVGGMGKLLKSGMSYARERGCVRVVTFSDHVVSDGGLYEKLGFTLAENIPPDYKYLVGGQRIHKFNYRLKRFRDDPSLIWKEGLSESELAKLNNLPRIWDCGKTRWEVTL